MKSKRKIDDKSSHKLFPLIFGMITATIIVVGLVIVAIFIIIARYENQRASNRAEYYLNTLSPEVTVNLCNQVTIPETIVACNTSELQATYGQMREIAEYLANQQLSYNEISRLFGDYEVSCSLGSDTSDMSTFRCMYQFDVAFKLIFVFDTEQDILIRIQ